MTTDDRIECFDKHLRKLLEPLGWTFRPTEREMGCVVFHLWMIRDERKFGDTVAIAEDHFANMFYGDEASCKKDAHLKAVSIIEDFWKVLP